ncbi:MAG TPA: carbohydrate-binding protein, partial [Pseudonocardiaceae bacterium]
AFRAAGGDVRISFGGQSGSELATTCSSESALQSAYDTVIKQFSATKIDFDVEGGAITNTTANTNRAKAIAALQKEHSGLDVSFTLPVMPTGLTQDGVNLVSNAKTNGVSIGEINVMAMDYGGSYSGDMGQYAEQAATSTESQVAGALGISNAWNKIAITPMIGANDVQGETFTLADATTLASFAGSKGMAWTSMWSAARDKACPGGATSAQPTCSGVTQSDNAFTAALSGNGTTGATTSTTTTAPSTTTAAPTTTTSAPKTTTSAPETTTTAPATSTSSTAVAWTAGGKYTVGELVTYDGATYKCLQAHTASDPTWTPPNTPSLWQKVS